MTAGWSAMHYSVYRSDAKSSHANMIHALTEIGGDPNARDIVRKSLNIKKHLHNYNFKNSHNCGKLVISCFCV